jgi:pilus assembly protein TadC
VVEPPPDLAATVDLLAVAVGAGATVPLAVAAVGASGSGPTAGALRSVTVAVGRGAGFVGALEELDRALGPVGRELRIPLASAVTSGSPVGPSLRRLADQVRLRRRRLVERRIRRLPVLLLLPLCGLVLPAFVVLTLVPVGLVTARELDLSVVDGAPTGPATPSATTSPGPP